MYKRQAIKDVGRETSMFFARCIVALFIVFILMVVLISRQFKLQVLDYQKYQTQSENNRISIQSVAPVRGLIYDRDGKLLAQNRSIFTLEITPEQTRDLPKLVQELRNVLTISDEQVLKFLEQIKFRPKFNSYVLKSNLTEEEVAKFSVVQHMYPGASLEARLERYYPYKGDLVHVLGRMGAINVEELEAMDEETRLRYAATSKIGKLGLERYYESILHGEVGSQRVETDVRGRIIRVLERDEPVAGMDIHLHLDLGLQRKATELMKEVGARGAIVAIEPATGGVLAMVSQPGYDPNLFTGGISGEEYRKLLTPERPLYNRAVQGTYSPASTIKPHLAWLGLKEGVITPETKIRDPGWFSLPNNDRRYRDWKRWGHAPYMDVVDSIIESCDTFFYDLAVRIGIDRIHEGMLQFGFGQKTGIDMEEEKIGILPSREWKRTARKEPWYNGDTVNIGIGQGYWTVTPLQLANATAVIANDGIRYQLQLVRKFVEGNIHEQNVPVMAYHQIEIGDGRWLDLVKESMRDVVTGAKGTARTAFQGAEYIAAGKTGTAQVKSLGEEEEYDAETLAEKFHDNALFIGYAPYENPKIAIAVVMENAGGGGSNAAPIARKLMDYYLIEQYLIEQHQESEQTTETEVVNNGSAQ
ncbi:penicillin-binding protein 2 [Kangiella aquimarina]|uniref:Peptidoglycan D,D-transpeptidase MrdA n=1 Tax=Kangiella aquimarina TaxID=261965 RepID=A0ABZ0X484_9GAMM|nr:penicillin-binding protein 2 [Kangiella aquimarina]WQG85363.1 penicillin-binding protein 2 [Kangiella aquimarina]